MPQERLKMAFGHTAADRVGREAVLRAFVEGDVGQMASSTSRTASWTSLSSNAEIPIGRVFPGSFGIYTRRIG